MPAQKVTCPNCSKQQLDGGKRDTCAKCGSQPMPSFSYNKASVFHPSFQPPVKKTRSISPALLRRKSGTALAELKRKLKGA